MRISDWSSDVCSSDLTGVPASAGPAPLAMLSPSVAVRQTLRRARPPAAGSAWIDPVELVLAGLAEQPAALEIGPLGGVERSEERRAGEEGVSKCRSGWLPSP